MGRLKATKAIAASLVMLILLSVGASAATTTFRARHALRFVARHQAANGSITAFSPLGSTADAVLAMVAARRGRHRIHRALGYLKTHLGDATTIGLKAKVVLAARAGGRDPRRFGGRNLVHEIKISQRTNGHYGSGGSVIDQALAMLALVAAGEQPAAPAATWLTGAQCPDGGWQFDAPYRSATDNRNCHNRTVADFTFADTNTTSYAVQALDTLAAPVAPAVSPFAYFRFVRDPVKHGWGYDQNTTLTDANSTALVLQAYAAAGRRHPRRSMHALKRLQYTRRCGKHFRFSFAFTWQKAKSGRLTRSGPDLGATIGAVLGLLRQPLPIPAESASPSIPRVPAC
jgi:hypothetical protein